MEDAIVLYPAQGIGHLFPMVEFGKLLLQHQPSFSIIILTATAPDIILPTAPYLSCVSATTPSINFHHLPDISIPSDFPSTLEEQAFHFPRLHNPNVEQELQSIGQKSSIKAFVIDIFCNSAFEVSSTLHIPTYYFYTSGATSFAHLLYFPTAHEMKAGNLTDRFLEPPGTPPIPLPDISKVMLDQNCGVYKNFLYTATQMAKSSGIIVNSFELLEPRTIKAINDGLCTPNVQTPPVYFIGPLVSTNDQNGGDGQEHECLSWLNSQPSGSVVFLCFGSLGCFEAEQLKEMAIGLESSKQRFLWVVRSPPKLTTLSTSSSAELDLEVLLPRGFFDRTKDRGLVVKSWAPQLAVLNHDSVGGFVTHCGWNSVLEAICAGVPMVAWPLYAEQRMNKVLLVEEMKVALKLNESDDGFVSAAELEQKVRELMEPTEAESGEGKAVRKRVVAMKDAAKAAMQGGGSSYVALAKLAESMKIGN